MSKILYLHHWGVTRLSCLLSLCQEASRQWVSHRDEPPRTISGPYLLPSKSSNVVFKKIIERENTARVIAQQKKKDENNKKLSKTLKICIFPIKSHS